MTTPKLLSNLRDQVRRAYEKFLSPVSAGGWAGDTGPIRSDTGDFGFTAQLATLAAGHVAAHGRDPKFNQLAIELKALGTPVDGYSVDTGREG